MNVATGGAKKPRAARPKTVRPARPRRQAPYDPFAPLTPKQMRQQAAAAVNAQIAPVIAQINAQIAKQEAQGAGNISALTRALANEYAGYVPAERSIYGEAQATQRADNAALADRLNAAGAKVAGNVGAQLAAIGAPAEQQAQAGGLAQVGQGAGNAQVAVGSSELARLVAEAASAGNYGAKLPGIAALAGTQQSGALLRQLENARTAQTGELRAKVPGLTADTLQQLRTQEFNKGVARQSGILSQSKARQQVAYEKARLGLTARGQNLSASKAAVSARMRQLQMDQQWQQHLDDLGIKQANLRLRATELEAKRRQSARNGGLTPKQRSDMAGKAEQKADLYYYGKHPTQRADGSFANDGVPAIDYQQAVRQMLAAGIPLVIAQRALNAYFKPGERGRPLRSLQQRQQDARQARAPRPH